MTNKIKPNSIGIGLRVEHYDYIFKNTPKIDFFEIISENFMIDGGMPLINLRKILEHYPVVQHGVALGIASANELDFNYLEKLKSLCQLTKTPWASDHLCWTQAHNHHYHELLPLPYTQENADFIAQKAKQVQDFLGIPFALENLSSYLSFKDSEMTEWEFYSYIIEKAGIHMLLDVNNVFVSSINHKFDPYDYLNNLPYDRIIQIHLAGHKKLENGMILDTHDNFVCEEVWQLYKFIYKKCNGVATLLEWDDDFISFEKTLKEALKAKQFH